MARTEWYSASSCPFIPIWTVLPPVDGVERAEAPIPDGEDEAQILVPMALRHRVVQLMVGG